MKKRFLLSACCILMMVSCENAKSNQAAIQAMIDSTVNAKMAKHEVENAAKNDSILKAMEKEKAEAMATARQEEKKERKAAAKKINDSTPSQTQPSK